ncbi:MAG: nitroreductase family deazaflavin-dependent oxidoreductase [Acidobacteriia bacterium]|nr:nitroreductase family deazaflavin-dependent oxidoreductase [Terriglobia bacterium]
MPLLYWRLGLKPLLVRARLFRFLVLTTKGRMSGQARHTMLAHFVLDDRIYIGAGWGERTQWYQNILVDPRVTVQARGPAFGAVARLVTDDEELRRLYWHARKMTPMWMWKRSLDSWDIGDEAEDFVAKKDRIPFLCLDPLSECPLPPLSANLVWVWPALAIAVVVAYSWRKIAITLIDLGVLANKRRKLVRTPAYNKYGFCGQGSADLRLNAWHHSRSIRRLRSGR